MEYVAVTDMGLSSQEFWSLTWWEWGLRVIRLFKEQKKRTEDQELLLAIARIQISDFRNVHRAKGAALTNPKDIFKLSIDTDSTQVQEVDREAFEQVLRKRFKNLNGK